MNRDIIKTDSVEYDELSNSYKLDLDVRIDDADFDNGVYIEDIKLYNQDMFVNPTNQSGGISFFDDVIHSNNKIPGLEEFDMIDPFDSDEIRTLKDNFFVADNDVITGHYQRTMNNGWAVRLPNDAAVVSTTYSLRDLYYKDSDGFYKKLEFSEINTVNATKYYKPINNSGHVQFYQIKNLQNDALFAQNFDISNDIIIISVKIHPNPDDKCQSDYILKAVYNKRLLLLESMAGVREIADTCTIPRRFIDFILRQKAIDLAQENNDIDLLCKYFKMFSGSIGTNKIEFVPCGCLRG